MDFKEELVLFETAKLAKEKGFDVPVLFGVMGKKMKLTFNKDLGFSNWNDEKKQFTSISTQTILQKWLREKHDIEVWVTPFVYQNSLPDDSYTYFVYKKGMYIVDEVDLNSFEKALEKGLQQALKLLP